MNTADMLALGRDYVNEATASYWSDVNFVRRLNVAQRKVALMVQMSNPNWLVKSTSVTPSASVITLPSDCSKPIYLEETSTNVPLTWIESVSYRRVSRSIGSGIGYTGHGEVYPLANTIEVNQDSYTNACTIWYIQRVPDLHTGIAASGSGENALIFASDRNVILLDDYYNNITVEVIDGTSGIVDIRSTISDYASATRSATITGTAAADDVYGTISVLPPETHDLIVLEAVIQALLKVDAKLDKDALTMIRAERNDVKRDVESWLESRVYGSDGVVQIGETY